LRLPPETDQHLHPVIQAGDAAINPIINAELAPDFAKMLVKRGYTGPVSLHGGHLWIGGCVFASVSDDRKISVLARLSPREMRQLHASAGFRVGFQARFALF